MSRPFRLQQGGKIDRASQIRFSFDGRALTGHVGDTIASALLANGITMVGRGLKFHRPRGVLSAGPEEPNALVTTGTGARREPSVRATLEPLVEGMVVSSQNCWPTLKIDLGRINDLVHKLLPAGFYNKTFIWPSWHAFEPAIRRMAGLGTPSDQADPDRYEWRNAHCDVLVVGGGAAGLLAATLAGRSGARVMLLETDRLLGGGWNWQRDTGAEMPFAARISAAAAALKELPGTRILVNTTAVGVYDHGLVTAVEKLAPEDSKALAVPRQRWWRIRARQVVLASGACEQPLIFPYNDLPGIQLADSMRQYLHRYAVAAGRRVVVATNNDSAYAVALDLRAAGIDVPGLLDTRANPDRELISQLEAAGVPVFRNAQIHRACGARQIRKVEFTADPSGARLGHLACDGLAVSGGWNPVANLYGQAGGRLLFDAHQGCLKPDGKLATIQAIGGAAANFEPQAAMQHTLATLASALSVLQLPVTTELPDWASLPHSRVDAAIGALGSDSGRLRDRTWIDFQHDVTAADIELAVRENLHSVEHVKRYTTVGMAIDQGKTSNLNGLALLAALTDRSIPEVGTTTFRPPFMPVTLGAIAGGRNGRFYRPVRLLPAHASHLALGAQFDDMGGWQRPVAYAQGAEKLTDTICREVRAVRSGVGLFDSSPLGKILVRGPDAAEFLNRIYANTMRTLEPGRIRYGIMLNEQGVVIDDGVCARLAAEEFWVSTTSSGASRIANWLQQWLQRDWHELQVVTTEVTTEWAAFTLAGPRARAVLASLPSDIDLAPTAFPHMQVRAGQLCGLPCRLLRVSFSGELSYEINVPADYAAALWECLRAAGSAHGIVPFGVEALLAMRVEKGFLHVGGDTDGTTIPDDIGFGTAVARKQGDFIGRRSLQLPEARRPNRMQLVGLRCTGPREPFVAGGHFVAGGNHKPPIASAGYLTSACYSPTLDQLIGLGLLQNGRARLGETVEIAHGTARTQALVVAPAHYDPQGERLDG